MNGEDPLGPGGQVPPVTDAGQSAGRAIAPTLAKHNGGGAAVNDYTPERAIPVVAEIEALGVRAIAVPADVGDLEVVRAEVTKAADVLGAVTLLVKNAGNAGPNVRMGLSPPFWETARSDWGALFPDEHVRRNELLRRSASPDMIVQGRGRILLIVSDAGRVGESRFEVYAAAKAARAGFMRYLTRETGRLGITCNLSTLQAPMEGRQLSQHLESEQTKRHVSWHVIRRRRRPDDVAGMVLFLCSYTSSWITGQTYPVTGG